MYKDEVMNGIEDLKTHIEKILADNYDYNTDMRANNFQYNAEQREEMVNKTDIIFNNIGKDYAESLQRITLLGDKIVFLEEKTEKGLESHDRDMDILEARIRSLVKDMNGFDDKLKKSKKIRITDISILEKRLIKLEEATIKHSDLLADHLEDRFKKLQAQVDKIAWGLQVVEERH